MPLRSVVRQDPDAVFQPGTALCFPEQPATRLPQRVLSLYQLPARAPMARRPSKDRFRAGHRAMPVSLFAAIRVSSCPPTRRDASLRSAWHWRLVTLSAAKSLILYPNETRCFTAFSMTIEQPRAGLKPAPTPQRPALRIYVQPSNASHCPVALFATRRVSGGAIQLAADLKLIARNPP